MGLHLLDTDLRLVHFNTASSGMRGVRADDITGRHAREVAPSVVTDVVEHLLRHVLDTGEPVIDYVQTGWPPADPRQQRVYSMALADCGPSLPTLAHRCTKRATPSSTLSCPVGRPKKWCFSSPRPTPWGMTR
ncbi:MULTISPECIES: PAS domain-containing protein [unclassified Streptomyces]|uniref:PAS domain-containing protein n=1 Tax=unclassified Streptomyces TaxID=2593676 RepID=UPI003D8A2B1C